LIKLLLVIFLNINLFANDKAVAKKIYISIAKSLSSIDEPSFYLHGNIKYLSTNNIKKVKKCSKADLVIVNNLDNLPLDCMDKLIFTTNYKTFMLNENIIGAFFWQKGRPNIVFRKSVLDKKGIYLDASFQKYIE